MMKEKHNGKDVNTKLLVDDGHVRNSLITVIVTHTIEFLGADINGGCLQWRFASYLYINLQFAGT